MLLEKPPLDGVYLAHFGIKGMRWGVSRASSSQPRERGAKAFAKRTAKRIAVVTTAATGAVMVSILLGRHGRTAVGEVAMTNLVLNRQRKAQAKQSPLSDMARRYREARIAWLQAEARKGGEVNDGN